MTADRWARTVRQQLGLGRLLPLGGARDGAWISEAAAGDALRRAVERDEPGVRVDGLRIALADPQETGEPVVPPPPSALPPGALRVTARFAATAAEPLPVTADRLRAVLSRAAAERIGLVVAEVDLRVTELLDPQAGPPPGPVSGAGSAGGSADGSADASPFGAPEPDDSDGSRVAAAALAVPGVSRLTGTLGRPVHLTAHQQPGEASLARRHARVDLAALADHRTVDVARAVRSAVSAALPDHPTVAVLVTALD
ncbi:nucleopolyhedrovirus P10 family protein [Streptomyces sp. NWU339]|uniref:nucleopolyhedrovirus P10 family protein n=1 Tax=Streptomyces sp. NWU339 TaxID=2185284 RepID=UPI000D679EE0|nr:nucleopolyhedrovirus P10 family protein [Streptomyces sp. NWU339]PWI08627.1 nucleopolyhedrovirus P10 family protein [Streptomyces sp. NWU339]